MVCSKVSYQSADAELAGGTKQLSVCRCDAAAQLVSQGYFPCAPVEPSFAVDFTVLQLCEELCLRTAPGLVNITESLEAILEKRGFRGLSEVWFHSHILQRLG